MKEDQFREWLVVRSLKGIAGIIANCKRVIDNENVNLDDEFLKDHCKGILGKLEYTAVDKRNNKPAKHQIPISGDIYDGTATLKRDIKRYIDFKKGN